MNAATMARAGRFQRLRYQIGGCLLFAALIPYVIIVVAIGNEALLAPVHQALIGSVSAIILGIWLYRNVSTFPGIEKSAYVLPAFTLSFTSLLLLLLLTRLEYNRSLLLAGYIVSIAWLTLMQSRFQRRPGLKIGVIPFGDTGSLRSVENTIWVTLTSPDAPVDALDAVTTDLRFDLPNEWDRRLADFALAGMPVYHTKHLAESLTGRVELEHLSENSFGTLAPVSAFMSFKHLMDWLTAAIVGVVLLPLFILLALAVRATSPGPALFRQKRIGYKGQLFTVYKFRTMTVASSEDPHAREHAMTQPNDQRVTRLGRFLRHTRIDELPQIINILKGEMSWIGPRPEAAVLSRWYENEIPFYRYRHIVRPGIAGWAQVCQGHVVDVQEVRSKLHYDFYYIKHYSAWIDLLIIARTVRTVLTGYGSR